MFTTEHGLQLDFSPPIPLVRELMREYADQLGIDLSFQDFESELANLPGRYAEPAGCLLVAVVEHQAAGCVAFRPLAEGICEMKRLYVRSAFRGRGLGRVMTKAVMERAGAAGYRAMRLDTLSSMTPAISLYESLGFRRIKPYTAAALPECVFFEACLKS